MSIKRTTENDVLQSCLEYLTLNGCLAWRSNNTGVYDPAKKCFRAFRGLAGVSDILGCLGDGRLLAVETKRPGGRLSAEQKRFLDAVRERGGLAFCVSSLQQLIDGLREEGILV